MSTRKLLIVVSKKMESAYRDVFGGRRDLILFFSNNLKEALEQLYELTPHEVIVHGKPYEIGFMDQLNRFRSQLPESTPIFLLDSIEYFEKKPSPDGIKITTSDEAIKEILSRPSPSMRGFMRLSAELGFEI